MKANVRLRDWELYVFEGRFTLSGRAEYHPVLGIDAWVGRTSSLVKYELKEDVLYYETRNTIYICPLEDMADKLYQDVIHTYKEELSHLADESDNVLDRIVAATACISLGKTENEFANYILYLQDQRHREQKKNEEKEYKQMLEVVKNRKNTVYIKMTHVSIGDNMVYHIGDETGVISPGVNIGMFQDSILYVGVSPQIDFRYFPKDLFNEMQVYHWSDNIECILIENDTKEDLTFNGQNVPLGQTMEFYRSGWKGWSHGSMAWN